MPSYGSFGHVESQSQEIGNKPVRRYITPEESENAKMPGDIAIEWIAATVGSLFGLSSVGDSEGRKDGDDKGER